MLPRRLRGVWRADRAEVLRGCAIRRHREVIGGGNRSRREWSARRRGSRQPSLRQCDDVEEAMARACGKRLPWRRFGAPSRVRTTESISASRRTVGCRKRQARLRKRSGSGNAARRKDDKTEGPTKKCDQNRTPERSNGRSAKRRAASRPCQSRLLPRHSSDPTVGEL